MDVSQTISALVNYAVASELIAPDDRIWAYNAVLEAVGETGPAPDFTAEMEQNFDLQNALAKLATVARSNGALGPQGDDQIFATRIMGLLMPRPTEIASRFEQLRSIDPRSATDYLYSLEVAADYVKTSAIARDIKWTTDTSWGPLQITINLSKPEKDPRDIARAAAESSTDSYPTCQLCWENEGYSGRTPADSATQAYPPRQNLRIVPITLGGQRWGLQYSPYAYFNEHCIALNQRHIPMHVDRACFDCLFDFVDLFPHYTIGSNADLPIVGGSILSHDHFQGGRYAFPMGNAPIATEFEMSAYPEVKAGIVKWPMTVLRLSGTNREQLIDAAVHILEVWRSYSDEEVGIVDQSEGAPHNTITPILLCRDGCYMLDLALRCNVMSDKHPFGVFHPHEELHHIKKENIGLIEVMGLAILPPRLERELKAVEQAIISGADLTSLEANPLTAAHASWACNMAARHPELDASNAETIIRDEVGQVFAQVLEQAGVFKWDDEGRKAFERFIEKL